MGEGKEDILKQRRAKALTSLRKLPFFGYSNNATIAYDFEFPTRDDILAMPADKPIQVVALKWHNANSSASYFGAIQLVLANGQESEIFRANGQAEKALTQVDFGFKVRKLIGTY